MCNSCNSCGCNSRNSRSSRSSCGCNSCGCNALTRALNNLFDTGCSCNSCNCRNNRNRSGCGCWDDDDLSGLTNCGSDNDWYFARQYALFSDRNGRCSCGCNSCGCNN